MIYIIIHLIAGQTVLASTNRELVLDLASELYEADYKEYHSYNSSYDIEVWEDGIKIFFDTLTPSAINLIKVMREN